MIRHRAIPLALVASVVLVVHLGDFLLPETVHTLRSQASDPLFRLRASIDSFREPYNGRVIHVDISDKSHQNTEGYYLDREDDARLIQVLAKASAQFHDIIHPAPRDATKDAKLIHATQQAGNVYFGAALALAQAEASAEEEALHPATDSFQWEEVTLNGSNSSLPGPRRISPTFEALSSQTKGVGFLDVHIDPDGVFRRAPLIARYGENYFPSLALRVVCDVLQVSPSQIELRPGKTLRLNGAIVPGRTAPETIEIPIDHQGRMLVNFIDRRGRTGMPHYEMAELIAESKNAELSGDSFAMETLQDEFAGKVVVVSVTSMGADVSPTPLERYTPRSTIHSTVIHNILTGRFLHWVDGSLGFFLLELPLLALLFFFAFRLRAVPLLLLAFVLTGGYLALGTLLFLFSSILLNLPQPVLSLTLSTIVLMGYRNQAEEKEKAAYRATFSAYFPESVVDKVMEYPKDLVEMVQEKELTILFSDIESFTLHSSDMEAAHLQELLSEYFEAMVDIVFEYGGTLDKFIGDGLMVFFGDPEEQEDHAERCVKAAIAMQEKSRALNLEWSGRGDMPLRIRIGINTGNVIVGNMGSRRRLSYTVIGSNVNLAQRLESAAPVGGILVSKRTAELLPESIDKRSCEPIQAKGVPHPIEVFEIPFRPKAPH